MVELVFDESASTKSYSILVADDQVYNRMLLQQILGNMNFKVELCADGVEAFDKLTLEHYDLLLVDVKMPFMDGIQLTRKIRNELSSPKKNIPIIAITAGVTFDEKQVCLSVGMNAFITKPIREQELFKTMATLLGIKIQVVNSVSKLPTSRFMTDEIDLTQLEKLTGGDQEFLMKLIESFIDSAETTSNEALVYSEQNNTEGLRMIAHRLAAAARHMGFNQLTSILKDIENTEDAEVSDEMRKKVTDMNEAITHAINHLRNVLSNSEKEGGK